MNENEKKYAAIERRAKDAEETAGAVRGNYAVGEGDARRIEKTVEDVEFLLARLRSIEAQVGRLAEAVSS